MPEDIFVEEEDGHAASAAANQRVDDRESNNIRVAGFGNRCLKRQSAILINTLTRDTLKVRNQIFETTSILMGFWANAS